MFLFEDLNFLAIDQQFELRFLNILLLLNEFIMELFLPILPLMFYPLMELLVVCAARLVGEYGMEHVLAIVGDGDLDVGVVPTMLN